MFCFKAQRTFKVNLTILSQKEFQYSYKGAQKCNQIMMTARNYLKLCEPEYFGLKLALEDEKCTFKWLDLKKTIEEELKETNGAIKSDADKIYKVYFCVKYFIPDPCKLIYEQSRHLFYLQLRKQLIEGKLKCSFDVATDLFAFILQIEKGDYDPECDLKKYVAEFMSNQPIELREAVQHKYKRIKGASKDQAQKNFLNQIKWVELYGVEFYPVLDEENKEHLLGLTPTGIAVYNNEIKVSSFFWPRITKLEHKANKLILNVIMNSEQKKIFILSSKESCKNLWKACVDNHNFFRLRAIHKEQPLINTKQATSKRYSLTSINQINTDEDPEKNDSDEMRTKSTDNKENAKPNEDSEVSPSKSIKSAADYKSNRRDSMSENESGLRKKHRRRTRSRTRRDTLTGQPELGDEANVRVRARSSSKTSQGRRRSSSNTRKSYYDPSETGHETSLDETSDPNEIERRRQIRRRKRSKSPGATSKVPEEIMQHIKYNIVDSNGMSQQELKEIPFVKIETTAPAFRISPHAKHRRMSPHRRKSREFQEIKQLQNNFSYVINGTAHIVKTNKISTNEAPREAIIMVPTMANIISINSITASSSSNNKAAIEFNQITSGDSGCEDFK